MMIRFPFLALLALGCSSSYSYAQEQPATQTQTECIGPMRPGALMKSLLEGYEKADRPSLYLPGTKGSIAPPEHAGVQIHVLSLTDVNQKRSEFTLNLYLRRFWNDPRLAFKTESQGGCFEDGKTVSYKASALENMWKPDFFIDNQADTTGFVGEGVWISPNGDIFWSTQMQLTLTCEMQFTDFPYDVQVCGLGVALYANSDQEVNLDFVDGMEAITIAKESEDGVRQALPQGGTPEWNILKAYPIRQDAEGRDSAGEDGASVEFRFELKRNSEYYSAFVIQPCVMFVMIGYASFFMNRSAAPARVGMSTIGFLANTNFLVGQLGQIPRLGKDVFLLKFIQMCAWFSFYCIIEYAVCNYLRRIQSRLDGQRKRMNENNTVVELNKTTDEEEEKPKDKGPEGEERPGAYHGITKDELIASGFDRKMDILLLNPKTGKMYLRDEQVDIFSRYAYPVAYICTSLGLFYTK